VTLSNFDRCKTDLSHGRRMVSDPAMGTLENTAPSGPSHYPWDPHTRGATPREEAVLEEDRPSSHR